MRIISEFRQRRIVQWTLSYIAGAFLALEALDQFTDRGYLPDLFYEVGLIWVVVAGLPAAIIIGWFHGEKGDQKAPPVEIGMLAVLAVVAVSLSGFTIAGSRTPELEPLAGTLDARRVAVLYFEGIGLDADHEYLPDALTEDLIGELAQVRALQVVSRNGAQQVRGLGLARDSIARLLNAGTLLEGSVEQRGGRVVVSMRLFDGGSGAEYPDRRVTLESEPGELLAFREQLVDGLARQLREALGQELALRQRGTGTRVQAAWSLLQQAERLRKEGLAQEAHDVESAIARFERADTLLERAEALDTSWVEPIVLRSDVAFRRVRASLDHPLEAATAARIGAAHAERALQRSRNHARAFELRGSNLYFLHMLRVTPDPAHQAALRDSARSDLQRAVQIEPSLASAHSLLSHLLMEENLSSAVIAAQRAYEEDAFLEAAPTVLWRLYTGSYNLATFTQAQRWCNEGARRFPRDWRFSWCELDLMTTPGVPADVPRARALVSVLDSVTPPADREFRSVQAELAMAVVLARAEQRDSARAILDEGRNRIRPGLDPDGTLTWDVAYGYLALGDQDEAIDVLQRAIAVSEHGFRRDREIGWRWRELQTHPRFRELMTEH